MPSTIHSHHQEVDEVSVEEVPFSDHDETAGDIGISYYQTEVLIDRSLKGGASLGIANSDSGVDLRAADRSFALYGVHGISVEGVIDITVQEACGGDRISNYRRVRLSTFGRLREAGFALLASFDHPHFTLVLADLSDITMARLERCFDDPIPNPGWTPER